MASSRRMSSLTFVVKFDRGLANRHRLPLDHVLNTLRELRSMIEEVGRELQREKGIEKPSGDFGLELLAGIKKGSLQVNIALTRDVRIGRAAAEEIICTVDWLGKLNGHANASKQQKEATSKIVRRLNRIADIQNPDKTEMRLELRNGKKRVGATFGEAAVASTKVLGAPQLEMEGVTLYGKLYQLRDSSPSEEEGKHFWGELRRDNGELWRVQFKGSDDAQITPLFRKQVAVTGTAAYYPVQTPKLVAEQISQDPDRDYEAAFDELYGCNKELYNAPLDDLLKEIRGDN